jgi:hypothetical protein
MNKRGTMWETATLVFEAVLLLFLLALLMTFIYDQLNEKSPGQLDLEIVVEEINALFAEEMVPIETLNHDYYILLHSAHSGVEGNNPCEGACACVYENKERTGCQKLDIGLDCTKDICIKKTVQKVEKTIDSLIYVCRRSNEVLLSNQPC